MVGIDRLDNVRHCVETVLQDDVPGDLLEAGVWRGGVAIFMRAILEAYGVTDRHVVVADSFAGLPAPDATRYPADQLFGDRETGRFAVDEKTVRQNFAAYGLLDDQVEWVRGWFGESLPSLRERSWSVIRLDGDLYQSTWECLENLYPRLSVGGFVIIDDWAVDPCREAALDYRRAHGITDEIVPIDWASVFWRRTEAAPLSSR
jgi:hypothetical protein